MYAPIPNQQLALTFSAAKKTIGKPQTLRDYQEEAVSSVFDGWDKGIKPLVYAATAAGKTTMFSEIAARLGRKYGWDTTRVLVLGHTEEIVHQIRDRATNQIPELSEYVINADGTVTRGIGVVMAEQNDLDARFISATRQSLKEGRLEKILRYGKITALIIDECHHAIPNSQYDSIWKQIKKHNPDALLAGFTGTPKRTDKVALGGMFDRIVYEWTISKGQETGYLVHFTAIRERTKVETSAIKTTGGDYAQDKLISVLNAVNWIDKCIDAYRKHIAPYPAEYDESGTLVKPERKQRQTIAFFPNVLMSEQFTDAMITAGYAAAHIDGETTKQDRRAILSAYDRGEINVISNCFVLTEGFDSPHTSAILWARPTRSSVVLTQAAGRGIRLWPGKTDCLFVDVAVVDAKVMQVGDLTGDMLTCKNEGCNTEFYKGLSNCPICGMEYIPEPKEKKEKKDKTGGVARIIRDELGNEIVSESFALFEKFTTAWFTDEGNKSIKGYYSVPAGFDKGAYLIAPPDYSIDPARIQERINTGRYMIEQWIKEGTKSQLAIEQANTALDVLYRMAKRADNYTLYHVVPKNKDKGIRDSITLLDTNEDLVSLMMQTESTILSDTSRKSYEIDKNAKWRKNPASAGQLSFLKALGYTDLPDDLTSGESAERITHSLSIRALEDYLSKDKLKEPKTLEQKVQEVVDQVGWDHHTPVDYGEWREMNGIN